MPCYQKIKHITFVFSSIRARKNGYLSHFLVHQNKETDEYWFLQKEAGIKEIWRN